MNREEKITWIPPNYKQLNSHFFQWKQRRDLSSSDDLISSNTLRITADSLTDPKRTPFDKNKISQPVDYSKIEELLKIRRWKAADEETRNLIVKVANREKEGWLDITAVSDFPCDVLREIDRLWVNYSEGRFGFSIQNKIYQECGGKLDSIYDEKAWSCFTQRVGWQVKNQPIEYEEVIFKISAPLGHLPLVGFWERGNQDVASLLPLFRIEICK